MYWFACINVLVCVYQCIGFRVSMYQFACINVLVFCLSCINVLVLMYQCIGFRVSMYWFSCINVLVFWLSCIDVLVIVYWCSGCLPVVFQCFVKRVSVLQFLMGHVSCRVDFVSERYTCRVVLCFQQAINLDPGYLDPGCRFPGQVIVIVKRQWDFRSTYASQGNSSRWAPDSVDKKRRGRPVAFVIVVPVAATVATITNH